MKRKLRSLRGWYNNRDVVSVYELVQCYGGPEEGGWWYIHWEKIYTLIVHKRDTKRITAELQVKYPYDSKYTRVNPHECYMVVTERYPGENATRRRPMYS